MVVLQKDEPPPVYDSPESPPPEFTPYEAEYVQTASGDIVSHDQHLNQDGEALYRFLLTQSTTPPTVRLRCRGSHTETRTRWVTRTDHHDRTHGFAESFTETVTDFDFSIDIRQYIVHGPIHWSTPDSEPAYRGAMVRQVDLSDTTRRNATRQEIKSLQAWKTQRSAQGLPPWLSGQTWFSGSPETLQSSRTLRQWADDYCSSPKHLKEFVYEKVIHGWNFENLREAIHSTIASSLYQGTVKVEFQNSASKIYIRPDNTLSRVLSNPWLFILSIIFLIYPFIWLYKHFHSHGGGRWEVCGGAYALKHYEPLLQTDYPSPSIPSPDRTQGSSSQPSRSALPPRLIEIQNGMRQLIGLREGEWFKQWEGTIRRAVLNRYISTTSLLHPDVMTVEAALRLDGYIA